MLISFSERPMLPYVQAGIRDYHGASVKSRVKRQTIRKLGPRGETILAQCGPDGRHPGVLHLWWKSRTKEKALLGEITCFNAFRILIENNKKRAQALPDYDVFISGVVSGTFSWDINSRHVFREFAHADGFEGAQDFADYFVPNPGDRFVGILYKW